MILNRDTVQDKVRWAAAGVRLPAYNFKEIAANTQANPVWLHFGAGNIFRAFIAAVQQKLLNEGLTAKGIIAAESFDYDIIDKIYAPSGNLFVNVSLNADATADYEVVASVAEALKADSRDRDGMKRLSEIASDPGLQLISFTITEKGYGLYRTDGSLLPQVEKDLAAGPEHPGHIMAIVAALLYLRYRAGEHPLAVVSMDNCSHNGDLLQSAVVKIAEEWRTNGFTDESFLRYLTDSGKVSFPWTMIDKITPRPAETVQQFLLSMGIEGMDIIETDKRSFVAPFVNAERSQYLVIEDNFPNSRPPLEKAGVYLTDRDTVDKVERMKVTTCLNPLHTAMSVYGCLLGYTQISEEMKDPDIVALIRRLGYVEGLPVVTDPGILSPKEFIDEVVTERLPNPFIPDMPQRIATDTSQKIGIRFGETIKSYIHEDRDLDTLVSVPLALAGWLRYLLAVDDKGAPMEVSPDPLLDDLQSQLSGIVWDKPDSSTGQVKRILANTRIFGTDLSDTILAGKIEAMFADTLAGPGAVRNTLQKYLQADKESSNGGQK